MIIYKVSKEQVMQFEQAVNYSGGDKGNCPACRKRRSCDGRVPWDTFVESDTCGPVCLAVAILKWEATKEERDIDGS